MPETLDGPGRLRRFRKTPALRSLVRETHLRPAQLIQPIFIQQGLDKPQPIASMPGCQRIGLPDLRRETETLTALGVGGVLLFGIPKHKSASGSEAADKDAIIQQAIRALKETSPDLVVMADACLCEYTTSGHCGIVTDDRVDNDATLPVLAKIATAQAEAGADIVAPSAMMDHQVAAIRRGLDDHGYPDTAILSYAAKHASAFYGPFREAAGSTPQFGDRNAYQMDPANAREASREIDVDVAEGADAILLKPGLPCLDLIRQARDRHDLPIGAYQVSGEYAMIKAGAQNGWLDEQRAVSETLLAMRRAGADFIVTYFAKQAAATLSKQR